MSISTKFDPLEKKKKENFISKRKDFFRVENSEDDKSKVFVLNNIKSANASWKFVTTVVTNGQVETSQEWSMTSFIAGSDDVVGDLNDLASTVCALPQVTFRLWRYHPRYTLLRVKLSKLQGCCLETPVSDHSVIS